MLFRPKFETVVAISITSKNKSRELFGNKEGTIIISEQEILKGTIFS